MPNFTTSHAFIIGINDYKYVTPLQTAVNDAQKLAEVLNQEIHSYRTSTYPNAKAHELRTLLGELPAIVGENDRVLFYFAGHGVAMDNEEDLPQGYLLPADADENNIANTFISMNELYAALDTLPCRHLLLVLDCCFSGAFKWAGSSRKLQIVPKRIYKELFDQYVSDRAWEVITSASYNETALDTVRGYGAHGLAEENTDHSPFAYALFKGIEGEADIIPKEKDGIITAKELHLYLRQKVTPMSIRLGKHSNKYRQTPSIFSLPQDDRGEYIFLTQDFRKTNLLDRPNQNPYKGLASYTLEDADYFYGREESITEVIHLVEGNPLTFIQIPSPKDSSDMHQTIAEELKKISTYPDFHILEPSGNVLETLKNIGLPTNSYVVDLESKLKNTVLFVLQYDKWSDRQCLSLEKQLLKWLRPQVPTFKVALTVSTNFEATYPQNLLKEYWNKNDFITVSTDFEENKAEVLQSFHQQIEGNPFTIVTGMSGSGKSSLVQAGVLPKLMESKRYEHRLVIHPLEAGTLPESLQFAYAKEKVLKEQVSNKEELSEEELKKKIAKEKEELSKQGIESKLQNTILVIDQYEYLITQSSPEKRKAFEEQLLKYLDANIRNFKVIITIRSDFEGSFKEGTLESYWTNKHRFIAKPFGLSELKQIITLPAAQYNVDFEEGLVDTIASEVYNQVGAMPLLSFALSTLYEKCVQGGNRMIGKEDYEEVGGVSNILHRQANEVYESFHVIARNGSDLCTEAKQCQKTMKKMMLRMVAQEGSDYTGRRVFLKELEYGRREENVRREIVINQLLGKRLIVKGLDKQTNQEYITPAHDALIRWSRLQEWIKNITATMGFGVFQRLREDIEANKVENTTSNKKSKLWDKNPSLDIVNEEREYAMVFRTGNEQERLRRLKSGAAWQLIKDLVNIKRRKTNTDTLLNKVEDEFVKKSLQKRIKGQRIAVLVAAIFVIGLVSALIFSLQKQQETDARRLVAEANNELKANYNVENALAKMDSAIHEIDDFWFWWREKDEKTNTIEKGVGLDVFNTLKNNGYIVSLDHGGNLINDIAISPNDKYLLSADDEGLVIIWNLANIQQPKPIDTIFHKHGVTSAEFSPKMNKIATGTKKGELFFTSIDTSDQNGQIIGAKIGIGKFGDSKPIHLTSFSPNGNYFFGSQDCIGYLIDPNSNTIKNTIVGEFYIVNDNIFYSNNEIVVKNNNALYLFKINDNFFKNINLKQTDFWDSKTNYLNVEHYESDKIYNIKRFDIPRAQTILGFFNEKDYSEPLFLEKDPTPFTFSPKEYQYISSNNRVFFIASKYGPASIWSGKYENKYQSDIIYAYFFNEKRIATIPKNQLYIQIWNLYESNDKVINILEY